ncbi:MAG: exosortase/archaeosortase family protein [Thermoguttaceae bacterium]
MTTLDTMKDPSAGGDRHAGLATGAWIGVIAMAAILLWSYSSSLAVLVARWWNDPDYLHGFLVPIFAGYLLWRRRSLCPTQDVRGSWWGMGLILVAVAMRVAAGYYYYVLLESLSLIPCLAGLALFVGGRRALRWAWPAVVLLVFMMPLPGFVAGLLSHPLQRVGTLASTYLLQTLGVPAVSQGNIIVLSDAQLGVVEACNGLRMMVLFLAVCVGAAFVVERPPLDKLIVVFSAAPIALVANVFRITLTGVLHETVSHGIADALFHDFAGWLMMPTAVVLLWGEVALLGRLLPVQEAGGPVLVKAGQSPAPRRTKAVVRSHRRR